MKELVKTLKVMDKNEPLFRLAIPANRTPYLSSNKYKIPHLRLYSIITLGNLAYTSTSKTPIEPFFPIQPVPPSYFGLFIESICILPIIRFGHKIIGG